MSEAKTAKVKDVVSVRKVDFQHGPMFYHKIVLDNGDDGEIGKKKEGGIKIGDSITYTLESSQWGNKIKAVQEGGNGFRGGGFKSQGSPASFALSYAKDLMVASMPFHQDVKVADWVDVTISAAKKFHGFLKENE